MDKAIKSISRDIRRGIGLDENIPQLFNHLANNYHNNGAVRLAMHYFAFYEAYCDDEGAWSSGAREDMSGLNRIIKEALLNKASGAKREKAIKEIDTIRQSITKRMDALTAYTDIFQSYEYVLNRLEYRFRDEMASVDEEEFAKEILRYIFDTEDSFIINEKIKEIVGQLPIRMTKQKYFELLGESLHAYLGAEQSSFQMYLYMLRTSAMLYHDEAMEALYPELKERKEVLDQIGYKDISKENYDKAEGLLRAVSLLLEIETNVYYSMIELVNEIYALLLCQPYAGMVASKYDEASDLAFRIIKRINTLFLKDQKIELPEEVINDFTGLEGVLEELTYETEVMEDALYEVKLNHKVLTTGLMLDTLLTVLLRAKNLLSNSLFMELGEEKEQEVVDETLIEKEASALQEELKALFEAHDRMIGRAVIANTINKMPVFFNNHTEVMDYVRYSLLRCSDPFEKAACIEIITSLMSN